MDCLMFLFYALVLCLCLYGGDDTWIVRVVAEIFADQTWGATDRTKLRIVRHGR